MVNMGDKLRKLRTDKGMTQKQIAGRIGVAVSAVSAYESGMRYPSYEVLIKLCRLYRVSSDFLLGIKETREINTENLTNKEIEIITRLTDVMRESRS